MIDFKLTVLVSFFASWNDSERFRNDTLKGFAKTLIASFA